MSLLDDNLDFNALIIMINNHFNEVFGRSVNIIVVEQVYDDELMARSEEDINWDDIIDNPSHWSVYWKWNVGTHYADPDDCNVKILFGETNIPYGTKYARDNHYYGGAYVNEYLKKYLPRVY